jgi:hypothetical protein
MKRKSIKVFYLLIFSLLSTLMACGDNQKQIEETAESRNEPSASTPCDPDLFQEIERKNPNTELKKESERAK